MERLLADVPSVASMVLSEKPLDKQLYICACNSISEVANKITPTSRCFGLLLAMDARQIDSRKISDLADKILGAGLVYLCAWGPDCERVHDLFDERYLTRELGPGPWIDQKETSKWDDVVMTTWHDDESLEEALWFFVHSAVPTASYRQACTDWVVAVLGNAEWEQEIRSKITKVAFEPPPD